MQGVWKTVFLEVDIWAEMIQSDIGFAGTVMTKEEYQHVAGVSNV